MFFVFMRGDTVWTGWARVGLDGVVEALDDPLVRPAEVPGVGAAEDVGGSGAGAGAVFPPFTAGIGAVVGTGRVAGGLLGGGAAVEE